MKMFEVGGCVRDEILGVPSKDIDFAVVLENSDMPGGDGPANPFYVMRNNLKRMGFKIFLETPEFLTVRAQFPKGAAPMKFQEEKNRQTITADFVLARKEAGYTDGRRPDEVVPGTLEDDLARRDFTMNAIAKDADGNLIDPFNGLADIQSKTIRCVGDPFQRFSEDALRAVRALRFSVTKGFQIHRDTAAAMEMFGVVDALANNISEERIQQELSKMFRFNTPASLRALSQFPLLTSVLFDGRVSLDATLKTKGRG